MEALQEDLLRRTHTDLTNRARGGIVIYLIIWLIITLPYQFYNSHPQFFYLNTAILVLVLISRMGHFIVYKIRTNISVSKAQNWLVWTILIGALHWGLMSYLVLTNDSYSDLIFYIVASTAVFGIAGTTALSICKEIRLLFPMLMIGPTIIALFMRGGTEDLIAASMSMLALVYVFVTSQTASQDYWLAITNQALAEQRAQQMEKLSITDQLTCLKNRSYFDNRFSEEWKRGDRQKTPISILMLDLDHFKALNDTYGHVFGDNFLRLTGQTLQSEIHRETDIVARYGGEEFVVLLPNTDETVAELVGEKLRLAISKIEMDYEGYQVKVTCSVGGATAYPDYKENADSLLKQADLALYKAKKNGRNRYQSANSNNFVGAQSA